VVVANEVITPRTSVLCEVLAKWSARNVIATGSDPSYFSKISGYFDIVLVDAPCSGEGMFHDRRVRSRWSDISAGMCAERQKRILASVWPSLRQGGMLIYCTCTFNPDENERNVAWMLRTLNAEMALPPVDGLGGIVPVELDGVKGYGLYPYNIRGEGFFMSAVIKTEPEPPPGSARADISKLMVPAHETRDVEGMMNVDRSRLLKTGREIWELPFGTDDFRYLARHLNIIKPGTSVATVKSTKVFPAHEAALASVYRKDVFPEAEVGYGDAMRYLKRHQMNIATPAHGMFAVKYRGVNLGWANSVTTRINNLYPVLWRILMDIPAGEPDDILKWQ
jgi:NOL1/NOP2/fmu family ribosome biogenesis protein